MHVDCATFIWPSMFFRSWVGRASFLLVVMLSSSSVSASCVILLHGLARSESSFEKMEAALNASGFQAVNLGYPSRDYAIDTLATTAIEPALAQCEDGVEINFVTHSLGGILVRQYLAENQVEGLGHVVMLGPPNQGSEVVDSLGAVPGFYWLNGEAGLQLGTDSDSKPNTLGPANFDVGIIAGDQSINWILSLLIPGSDDGKVAVERTKLVGMNDHLVVSATHPLMMNNDAVIAQVIFYLRNGRFDRAVAD